MGLRPIRGSLGTSVKHTPQSHPQCREGEGAGVCVLPILSIPGRWLLLGCNSWYFPPGPGACPPRESPWWGVASMGCRIASARIWMVSGEVYAGVQGLSASAPVSPRQQVVSRTSALTVTCYSRSPCRHSPFPESPRHLSSVLTTAWP